MPIKLPSVVQIPTPLQERQRFLQLTEHKALEDMAQRNGIGTEPETSGIFAAQCGGAAGIHKMQLRRPDLLAGPGGRPRPKTVNNSKTRENVEIGVDGFLACAEGTAKAGDIELLSRAVTAGADGSVFRRLGS